MIRQQIRSLIEERLRAGIIPSTSPARTYGGQGEGANCDCCGLPISELEVQYELDFPTTRDGPARTFIAHRECHRIWRELAARIAPKTAARISEPSPAHPER